MKTSSQPNIKRKKSLLENANNLRDEMNYKIMQEMDGVMKTVSTQLQRTISDVINKEVFPGIQNSIECSQSTNVEDRNGQVEEAKQFSGRQASSPNHEQTLFQANTSRDARGSVITPNKVQQKPVTQ